MNEKGTGTYIAMFLDIYTIVMQTKVKCMMGGRRVTLYAIFGRNEFHVRQ